MSAFDKVIGYETIKKELRQIVDMLKHSEVYEKIGAKVPNGLLLSGIPGVGKSLLCSCFIEEVGLKTYYIRKNKGDNFIDSVSETFKQAKENAPSIVFCDDLDKIGNPDGRSVDAPEYVAVQAGIDEVKDSGVFVLATVNEMSKLPRSLTRAGRFDRKIELMPPTDEDAAKIIKYYLSDKKIADDVDFDNLAKMISYSNCADLETILNEAAITASYARKEAIEMSDFVHAVLRMQYDCPDDFAKTSDEELKKTAMHEAGHLVIAEVLNNGCVGLASLRTVGRSATGGFIHLCKDFTRKVPDILVSLAGKVATEMYFSEVCASGCNNDLYRACVSIRDSATSSGKYGMGFLDVSAHDSMAEITMKSVEDVVRAELERYIFKVKDILIKNREFLEKTADALVEKKTLLYSDIQEIRNSCKITEVAIY